MPRISVLLSREEGQALIQLALEDLREPNVEARFLLRQELIRRGTLKANGAAEKDESSATPPPSAPASADAPANEGT
jgi:hypothetical protein